MRVRNKIALLFTLIVASILAVFSIIIYQISAIYRSEVFYDRLENNARTKARFLVDVKEIDNDLLKIIDQNALYSLYQERILIFDPRNVLIYDSAEKDSVNCDTKLIDRVRSEHFIEEETGIQEWVGIEFKPGNQRDRGTYVIIASAYDKFGIRKLENLKHTLLIGWGLIVVLTSIAANFFAGLFLKPVKIINEQVQQITGYNLKERIPEGKGKDEITQLALNFNQMLDRLEASFLQQRSFVSHASHELRTPLAALKIDIQSGLEENLTNEEYQLLLNDLLYDTDRLIGLTNSLLQLARPLEVDKGLRKRPLSILDLLLDLQATRIQPGHSIDLDLTLLEASSRDSTVQGEESLLKTLFSNLIDNACKYSLDHTASIYLQVEAPFCSVCVKDNGIGIAPEDQQKVFSPFYRASNALRYTGYGIGLAVCQRIAEWHGGNIKLESTPGKGTTLFVRLPLA
ncbi:MAG: ATP-binding protein [Siphonobacter sp.]